MQKLKNERKKQKAQTNKSAKSYDLFQFVFLFHIRSEICFARFVCLARFLFSIRKAPHTVKHRIATRARAIQNILTLTQIARSQ